MNTKAFWKRPLFWICLPLLATLGGVIWLGATEALAEKDYRARIAAMQAAGRPVSNADLERLYNGRTNAETSKLWNAAITLLDVPSNKIESEQLPYLEIGPKTTEIDIGEPWEFEQQAAELLAKYEPAIAKLHSAIADAENPAWAPIEFDGMNTPLWNIQNTRSAARLLQLEAEYSLRTNDTDRAMRAIGDIFSVADSIDLTFAMSLYYQNFINSDGYALVRRSLSAGTWSAVQLDTLAQLTQKPAELSEIWPGLIDNEIAAIVATLAAAKPDIASPAQSFAHLRASLPSSKISLLKSLAQLREARTDNLLSYRDDIVDFQDANTGATLFWDLVSPNWYPQLAQSVLNTENDRRLTQAAIAVKRYQLREGSWPEDLQQVLLDDASSECITTVDNQSFGYETGSGVSYIWKHRTSANRNAYDENSPAFPAPIPSIRPTDFTKTELEWISSFPVVTIR